jgi:2-deoxy-D-gluconate 3-dehydrogenase
MAHQLFDLAGKTALVTGASRGLGQAIAIGLGRSGANIVCSSSQADGCDQTEEKLQNLGIKSRQIAANLADESSVRELATQALNIFERIDILINVGGTIFRAPAKDYPYSEWQRVMQVNLDASFVLAQTLAPAMMNANGGKIINIASMLSYSGGINVPAYTASKHAVAGLTKALANEWGKDNIQVNAIAPGYFRTDNTQALQDDPDRSKEIENRIPCGRWGTPEDLVGAAVFLSSAASDYVNGHVLAVDGGWLAR